MVDEIDVVAEAALHRVSAAAAVEDGWRPELPISRLAMELPVPFTLPVPVSVRFSSSLMSVS